MRPLSKRMSDVRLSKRRVRAIVDAVVALATDGPWTMADAYEAAYSAAAHDSVRNDVLDLMDRAPMSDAHE